VNLIKTSFLSGIHTIVKLITNVIIGKLFAVYLGPTGISQLGNLMNVFTILNGTMSGGINGGIVKMVAENKDNKSEVLKVIYNSFLIMFVFSLCSIIIYFSVSHKISFLIFQNYNSSFLFLSGIVFMALFSTYFNYCVSILNGLGHIKQLTFLNIIFSIIIFLLTLFLVSKYFILGVIYSNSIAFFIVMIFGFYILSEKNQIKILSKNFDKEVVKKLLQYTLMTFTSMACVPLVQIFIRDFYTSDYGVHSAGIWQGLVRLSESYLSVFSIILITYFLPKYSEVKDRILLRNEIRNAYKYLIPSLLFFFVIIYILRNFIVESLFSKEFLIISNYLSFMFIGDFLKISSWILAFLFLAKSKTKIFIVTEVVFSFILLLGTIILSPFYELMGYVYSYIVCYFLYLIFCIFYFRRILF